MAMLFDVELGAESTKVLSMFLVVVGGRSVRATGVTHENKTCMKSPEAVKDTGELPPVQLGREIKGVSLMRGVSDNEEAEANGTDICTTSHLGESASTANSSSRGDGFYPCVTHSTSKSIHKAQPYWPAALQAEVITTYVPDWVCKVLVPVSLARDS